MRKKDLDEQLGDIERRRIEGKLSHEEAILAKQNLVQINKQKVAAMKEEVCSFFSACFASLFNVNN